MGAAAHQGQLADREFQLDHQLLRQKGHRPGENPFVDGLHVMLAQSNPPLPRFERAAHGPQQRRLAAAVGSQYAQEFTGRDGQRHVSQGELIAVAGVQVLNAQHIIRPWPPCVSAGA